MKLPLDGDQSIRPFGSSPRSSDRPLTVSSFRAPLAAHQRAQAELDVEIGGTDLAEVVGAADGDGFQPQRGRRQQARVEIAGDTNRRADDLGRLRLELRPELVPVNEIRTDQRSDQCKNEGDCQAEQRRLHGVSL
ncbi:hypothetical protein ACVIHD_007832 [Bradyrhizobium embrapense]